MYKVRKRDNSLVEFDLSKISDAMVQAFEAQNVLLPVQAQVPGTIPQQFSSLSSMGRH